MSKLKVALLEDSKVLLKDLIYELERTDLVRVVAHATGTEEFVKKVAASGPEALLLDIDISGDSMNGLDVAAKLKLPVLFLTGKMRDHFESLPGLEASIGLPVKYLTKPITLDKLNGVLPMFIKEVRLFSKPEQVKLTLRNEPARNILLGSIVCLGTDKENGSGSNNKEIFFTDRPPGVLVDFSFKNMEELGLLPQRFLTIHKSFRVSATHVEALEGDMVRVRVMNEHEKLVEKLLPVSENYRPAIKKQFL